MKDLKHQRFGRLMALYPIKKRSKRGKLIWLCQCDCGKLIEVRGYCLIRGSTQSCGCLQKEQTIKANLKHGYTINGKIPRLYSIWAHIKQRCLNPNSFAYKWYGDRGVAMCKEWKKSYPVFRFWALLNGYEDNLTIDRINHRGDYKPSNCQWITKPENTRKANKERFA